MLIISNKINMQKQLQISLQSRNEMKLKIKQNQAQIQQLRFSIKKKQSQMKQVSQRMSRLIEKKLGKNQSPYTHPNFNPQFPSPHLQSLHAKKQSIYGEIAKIKQEISAIVLQEEPEVTHQAHTKKSKILQITTEQSTTQKQKQLLQQSLHHNKKILQNYKQSQCILEIQQNQKQLENIKKYIRELEKDIKVWMHDQIVIGLYVGDRERDLERMGVGVGEQVVEEIGVEGEFEEVVGEIRNRIQQKKVAEREFIAKKEELNRKIQDLVVSNIKIDQQIRDIMHMQIQKHLTQKKQQILNRNKSQPTIPIPQNQPKQKHLLSQKQKHKYQTPTLLLTQPPQQIKKKQIKQKKKDKQKQHQHQHLQSIIIGTWRPENLIQDDVVEMRNISRAIWLKVRTKEQKITGMGVTYIDKIGVEVLGRSNIWKLSDDTLEVGENQQFIDLEDVVGMYYNSPAVVGQGTIIPIGIKLISKSSKPIIKIGQLLNQQSLQFINLQTTLIKTVQFTLDTNYKTISGIRMSFCEIENQSKIKDSIFDDDDDNDNNNDDDEEVDVQENKDSYKFQESDNKELSLLKEKKSVSVDGRLTKKKLLMKNTIKKLSQVEQVDHRLLLNRKKKLV